jgi:hypothetical protein
MEVIVLDQWRGKRATQSQGTGVPGKVLCPHFGRVVIFEGIFYYPC